MLIRVGCHITMLEVSCFYSTLVMQARSWRRRRLT